MEAKALQRVFGDTPPPCCSFKGALGHTSGGGALLELLLSAEFLKRNILPPTMGFSTTDIQEPLRIDTRAQPFDGSCMLVLAAGFGGINAAAVLKKAAV
jgi:3-oxoacyl-(acyl-carrier-protein) synthase